jgi:hypothetical protein
MVLNNETVVLRFCCSLLLMKENEAKKKEALRLYHQSQNLVWDGYPQSLKKTYQSDVLYDPSWAPLANKKNRSDQLLFSDGGIFIRDE